MAQESILSSHHGQLDQDAKHYPNLPMRNRFHHSKDDSWLHSPMTMFEQHPLGA
jgi:hypothetical protein